MAVAAADTSADISANAFTIDGTTFDPGSGGYNTFGPLASLAPLLEIGSGSTGIGTNPGATQDLEVYDSGSDAGTAHTSATVSDLLGIDTAQFTIQGITPPVDDIQAALTGSDLDLSGVNVADLANALTATGFFGIPYGTDITGSDVGNALLFSDVTLPSSVTDADIAGVLNGIDVSDLPDVGTVYSITNLGSGWANVYEAVPNADGTAAAHITDTLVTPFGNMNIPTSYDAVAHLNPGAAFTGLGATSDNSDVSANAFTIDGTTFDPGSDGFTPQFPLFSSAPLLELAGATLGAFPVAGQNLEVYNSGGSDLGNVSTSMNTQNLLGLIDATQLTVTGDNLPVSDVASALSASDIDFSGLDTTAADVANLLGPIGLSGGPLNFLTVYSELIGAVPNLSLTDATDITNVLNSAVADFTPSADLPADGTVYSVANLGSGWENIYVATPNADGTAAASITDTFVTPYGNLNIPTSYDAIAPMDAGAPFAGLHVASDNSDISANAFTIDGTTFDPGTDGFTPVPALTGNAPLLEVGGGFPVGTAAATTIQDLDVFGSNGSELGSIGTWVTTSNIFGLIDTTQLNVEGYNVPAADFVTALDSSDINFTGAGFSASDLVNALENPEFNPINLGSGDVTGTNITSLLFGSGINLSAAGIDPDDVASVLNGATDAYGADLPDLGTVYSVTDFGGGFENVYEAIPNADGSAASSITDYLVTPFGNVDLSTMFDAIAQLDPGDAAAGVSDAGSAAAASSFDLFDPSSWF